MKRLFKTIAIAFACNTFAHAQVRLPALVRDSMILQRNTKVNVWGWATPGEKVSVKLNGKTGKTITGSNGKWLLQLPPMKAGGPYTMQIDASNHIALKDILIGDVWLCSGQSNMVHQMGIHNVLYAADIAKANYPQIRQFWVPNVANLQGAQQDLPTGSWKWANPQDVLQFSAVAYFFARNLHQKYGVPVGIINASWGGTPIEAWMSEEGLKAFPNTTTTIEKNKDIAYINGLNRKSSATVQPFIQRDKGMLNSPHWYDTAYQPKGWRSINIPGYWEDQGVKDLDGVVWYRKEVDLPASVTNTTAKVFFGRIVDADVLYINGRQVGNTTYMYPQRRYAVPEGLLKPGKNLFVIRVQNNGGKGGFVPDKPYYLTAGKDTIDLKGTWEYKVGEVYMPQRGFGGGGIASQNQPAALYNAMIAPLQQYAIKGFVWYQGESNAGNPQSYNQLLPALITNWRNKWQGENLPFLYAQLPGFMDRTFLPAESNWALLREAQLKTLAVPHTGMAVTIDVGEWNDIHPDRKKEVGERLALAAAAVAYGEQNLVTSGPLYQKATINGNKISVSFTNTGSGLFSNDDEPLNQFAIAGANKKWVWAQAKIEGNTVTVWSDEIPSPMYVRYAWADNPDGANLYNKEGLPASPFRTDN